MTRTTLDPKPKELLEEPENATRTSDYEISDDARRAFAANVVTALERADDLLIALEIRRRTGAEAVDRVELADFVRDQGYAPRRFRTLSLRVAALRYLARLKTNPRLGLRLHDHPATGDFSDCRKIYFDERAGPPRWRIVYRLSPNESTPRSVEIISIGRRAHATAYVLAARRLGRMS